MQNDVIVNLGQLTGNGTTLISAYLLQVMMLHILYGQQRAPTLARRWSIPLVVALAGLSGFFLATPTTADKFASPDAPAGVLTYYLIYACYLGVTLGAMVVLLRRYASQVADRWLRRSLRLYEWSCLVGMLYLAGRIGDLVIGRVNPDSGLVDDRYGTAEFLVAAVLPALAFALVVAAVTIRNAGRATEYRLADRRLRPLWEAVRAVRPYAVLPVPRRAGARLRLYRRVIEIQDAELAAAERVGGATLARIDAAVAEAGLTGEDARATRDAAILAAGLAALSAGEPRPDGPASGQQSLGRRPGEHAAMPGQDVPDLVEHDVVPMRPGRRGRKTDDVPPGQLQPQPADAARQLVHSERQQLDHPPAPVRTQPPEKLAHRERRRNAHGARESPHQPGTTPPNGRIDESRHNRPL